MQRDTLIECHVAVLQYISVITDATDDAKPPYPTQTDTASPFSVAVRTALTDEQTIKLYGIAWEFIGREWQAYLLGRAVL